MGIVGFLAQRLAFFQPWEYNAIIATGVDPSATDIVAKKAGYRIRVTYLVLNVTTSAAQTITIRDDNGTPVVIHVFPANTAVGGHEIKFGELGFPCTIGCALDLLASAAGYGGTIHIEGYYEPLGVFDLVTTKP